MKHAFIIVLTFLVSACASYTEDGIFGGFNEVKLAQDTYRIQAKGNSLTSRNKTNAIAFVRAAELAVENGYDRFVILDYDEWSKTSSFNTPGYATKTTNFYGSGYTSHYSGYSSTRISGTGYSRTTFDPGQTITTEKPRTDIVVKFIDQNAPQSANALLVQEVLSQYGQKAGFNGLIDTTLAEATTNHQTIQRTSAYQTSKSKAYPATNTTQNVGSDSARTPTRKSRSMAQVYDSLSDKERAYVDSLPEGERFVYLAIKNSE